MSNLNELYESKSIELKYMAPLILALKSLIAADSKLKATFLAHDNTLISLFSVVS